VVVNAYLVLGMIVTMFPEPAEQCQRPFALDVFAIKGDRIAEITSFVFRSAEPPPEGSFENYPDHALDAWRVADYERFDLPPRIGRAGLNSGRCAPRRGAARRRRT
jgi:hypothetical protein